MVYRIAFKPSDKVTIKESGFVATVNKAIIERECIMYECQWWDNRQCVIMSFYESELEATEQKEPFNVEVF